MAPDDPRHGSHAGYQKHRADGEDACEPCLRANTAYHKRLVYDHHRGQARKTPAIGARRRIQALQRLGWSLRNIAERCPVGASTTVLTYILDERNDTILRSTHEAIVEVYDALSMRLPAPSSGVTRAQKAAEAKGYLPPLAYDEGRIDDPAYQPRTRADRRPTKADVDPVVVERALLGERLDMTKAERAEVVRRWRAAGKSLSELERRLGIKPERYKEAS